MKASRPKILFLIAEDWYFCSHRLPLACAARDAGFDVLVATRINSHAHLIEAEGFRLIPIKLRRGSYNPIAEVRSILELIRIYRTERPTLVHHVAMKPVLYGSFAAWIGRVPNVVNAIAGLGHIFVSDRFEISVLRAVIKYAFRVLLNRPGSRVIFQNPDDRELLTHNAIVDPELTRLIKGAGVDPELYKAFPEPEGSLIVVLPSRMLWDKGIAEFVQASEILKKNDIHTRFVLVGRIDKDSPSSIPSSQLMEWQEMGIVEWWGHSENMPEVFAQSHIVCSPTFYGEGIPKALIEAAACGRPIITTDIPGCREVVRDGINGLLVPPKDVQALVDALALLIANPEMRREIGSRGRDIVIQEFSQERVLRETLSVYEELQPG